MGIRGVKRELQHTLGAGGDGPTSQTMMDGDMKAPLPLPISKERDLAVVGNETSPVVPELTVEKGALQEGTTAALQAAAQAQGKAPTSATTKNETSTGTNEETTAKDKTALKEGEESALSSSAEAKQNEDKDIPIQDKDDGVVVNQNVGVTKDSGSPVESKSRASEVKLAQGEEEDVTSIEKASKKTGKKTKHVKPIKKNSKKNSKKTKQGSGDLSEIESGNTTAKSAAGDDASGDSNEEVSDGDKSESVDEESKDGSDDNDSSVDAEEEEEEASGDSSKEVSDNAKVAGGKGSNAEKVSSSEKDVSEGEKDPLNDWGDASSWGLVSISNSLESGSGDIDIEGAFDSKELAFANGSQDQSSLASSFDSSEEDIDAIDQAYGGDADIFTGGVEKAVDVQQPSSSISQQEEEWFDDTDPAGYTSLVLVLLIGFAALYVLWQRQKPVTHDDRRAGYTPIHSRGKSR
jgi:hypothetical protein